jgi:transposase
MIKQLIDMPSLKFQEIDYSDGLIRIHASINSRRSKCPRKVFSEQTPDIIRYSRRTKRATRILETFAVELTGRLGSIISDQLHITVSSSTITRIAYSQQLPDISLPRVLGVDDWAYRKGVSYGTILIDMETSRPIELLPSRDGQVLKECLLKYNDVKIVTRDRASSYTAAIIVARLKENGHKLMDIFREIKELGYTEGRTQ